MKVLITGGTGFIGQTLTITLLKKKYLLTLLTRNPKSTFQHFEKLLSKDLSSCLKTYAWDMEKADPPFQALKDVEAVIHLAGAPIAEKRWNSRWKKILYETRVQGTKKLIFALKQSMKKESNKGPHTFISASAIGVYGCFRKEEKLMENSSLEASLKEEKPDFLSQLCLDWEKEVFQGWKDVSEPPRLVALRISNVLGEEGGLLKKLLPVFKRHMGASFGSGKHYLSWIHIHDMVRMILFCLENKNVKGPVNASAPEPITDSHFTKALAHTLKKKKVPFKIPFFVLYLLTGELSKYIVSSLRVIPDRATQAGFQFHYPSLEKALKHLCCSENSDGQSLLP